MYGEASLNGRPVVGKALGKMWGITKTTNGMVSLAATYVRAMDDFDSYLLTILFLGSISGVAGYTTQQSR